MQLIERIDRHELDACFRKNLIAGYSRKRAFKAAVSTGVAVVIGCGRQRFGFPQPDIVHTPGIRAQSGHRQSAGRNLADSDLQLFEDPRRIPAQGAIHTDGAIGESVNFFQR